MKKALSVFIFTILLGNYLFAQDGYLNFRWGMSLDEVRNLLDSNAREGFSRKTSMFSPASRLMFHLYGTEIVNVFEGRLRSSPHRSIQIIDGEFVFEDRYITYSTASWSNFGDGAFAFFFENNRLIGVQTIFVGANVIRELETRHGRGNEINNISFSLDGSTNNCVWLDNNRFIIWTNPTDRHRNLEFVSFMDAVSLRRICQSSMEQNRRELREEQQRTRSRLD